MVDDKPKIGDFVEVLELPSTYISCRLQYGDITSIVKVLTTGIIVVDKGNPTNGTSYLFNHEYTLIKNTIYEVW